MIRVAQRWQLELAVAELLDTRDARIADGYAPGAPECIYLRANGRAAIAGAARTEHADSNSSGELAGAA
jgi:hypothetical protein